MERTRRRSLETGLGLGLVAALVASVLVIYKSFSGDFGDDVTVSAHLSKVGDALEPGDIVTYRDMIVGRVTTATGSLDGTALLGLKIHRDDAKVIPADVTAVAVPASLFGATKVMLLPPSQDTGSRLAGGDVIAADTTPTAQSLQTALANAYTLLTAVHPAQLDAALSALADALRGQGEHLGHLVEQADAYLKKLAPSLPALNTVISSLADVTDELAANAPSLLTSVGNLLVAAKGIQQSKQAVAQLLDVAPTAVADAQLLLSPENVDHTVTILRDEGPVIDAFGADPDALPKVVHGFKSFADTFSGALEQGPYLKANIILTGVNLAALLNVAIGKKGEVFRSVSDPQEYTAANCPRYPGASSPSCTASTDTRPSDAGASVLTSGDSAGYGGTASSVGSPREVRAVRGAASAITGVPAAKIPAAVDLVLGPLLRGTPTVIM
jgi:phospholipid/cholesterol/gamma-HCH transport system substrate-binding protein